MSLKHIIKYMAVPVVAAFALVGCSHEDFTTAPKSSAEKTETTTKKRTIKVRLNADIELPKGAGGRGIEFALDHNSDRYRPFINWDVIKNKKLKLKTRLYFRKMKEGKPSTERKDIFSVVIDAAKWTAVPKIENGHLKLGVDQLMEVEVPQEANDNDAPFLPESEYPKNAPQDANEEWQVAAIISVSLNGDFSKGEEGELGYELAKPYGAYFPQQYIMDKLGTDAAYAHHEKEFDPKPDPDDPDNPDKEEEIANLRAARPFKYDGYWMLYPKTMYFDHDTPTEAQTMEIPFCSDWKNVQINEQGVVSVQLQAKSPGMILHYELTSADVDAMPDPKAIASARGLSFASRGAKQTFRSPGASGGEGGAFDKYGVDNLKSTACTFYGALWYDQKGNTVHWSRGKIDLTTYQNDLDEDRSFMKENTLSVYVRGAHITTDVLEANKHCHILYFVMPPYDGKPTEEGATTAFWLQPREQENSDADAQPSDYKYLPLSYQLKKKGETSFHNQYVSKTKLSPGKIHWVRLQYKKLATPIPFDPDAQP